MAPSPPVLVFPRSVTPIQPSLDGTASQMSETISQPLSTALAPPQLGTIMELSPTRPVSPRLELLTPTPQVNSAPLMSAASIHPLLESTESPPLPTIMLPPSIALVPLRLETLTEPSLMPLVSLTPELPIHPLLDDMVQRLLATPDSILLEKMVPHLPEPIMESSPMLLVSPPSEAHTQTPRAKLVSPMQVIHTPPLLAVMGSPLLETLTPTPSTKPVQQTSVTPIPPSLADMVLPPLETLTHPSYIPLVHPLLEVIVALSPQEPASQPSEAFMEVPSPIPMFAHYDLLDS